VSVCVCVHVHACVCMCVYVCVGVGGCVSALTFKGLDLDDVMDQHFDQVQNKNYVCVSVHGIHATNGANDTKV
jgi:hypothetical protein